MVLHYAKGNMAACYCAFVETKTVNYCVDAQATRRRARVYGILPPKKRETWRPYPIPNPNLRRGDSIALRAAVYMRFPGNASPRTTITQDPNGRNPAPQSRNV